jgi:mannan endo-1,4-beta-mannosidase
MRDGSLSFSVQVQEAGAYLLSIVYSLNDSYKAQNLVINGATAGIVSFVRTTSGSRLIFEGVTTVVSLAAGDNTIDITRNWGWVDIDYIEISKHQSAPFTIVPHPVTPHPTESARKLYSFLRNNFQEKTISGVMTGTLLSGSTPLALFNQPEIAHIYNASGKRPALVGFDFMHSTGLRSDESWFRAYSNATISMATTLWEEGGIPVFCWHWKDPLHNREASAFYSNRTTFNLASAFTDPSCTAWDTNSAEYKAIIRDIDIVSGLLKQLQDRGVAILWRPLHEASGEWFWWGRDGNAAACKALYLLMFDRMVYHHGLRNLIWVWTSDGVDYHWYPGDDYADIIGRDFYFEGDPREKNHSSLLGEFETLKNVFGTNKMIALAENGSIPYPENIQIDNANWLYFMPWYGEYVRNDNTAADWHLIMNDDYIITLEDMPGWGNYIYTAVENNRAVRALVYPTVVKDTVYVVCSDFPYWVLVADAGGRLIHFAPAVSETTAISCGGWESGIYYISVINEAGKRTFRVIR